MRCAAAISLLVALATFASASPNVPLDEPVYEELARLQARGRPLLLSGFRPLTRAHLRRILAAPDDRATPEDVGWWIAPVERVVLRTNLYRSHARTYSTPARPRDLAGSIDITCERQRGTPCGTGAGVLVDLESSAGYGSLISAAFRLRGVGGSDSYDPRLELDTGYVNAEVGPIAVELGRDAFVFGPAVHTQLAWGNAGPIDHVRVSTSAPYRVGSTPLSFDGTWVVGRLAEPQTYPGNLVSIVRGGLDVSTTFQVALMQLLQLGGNGAPSLGVGDFLLEHVRRKDPSAGNTDSSNRRFGGDVAFRINELRGARFYYAIMFEDIRRARFIDAVRYDADHLLGVELASLGASGHSFVLEWHITGVRSHEHTPRTTGFTHDGKVVGSPLGPDARSIFAELRLRLGAPTVSPWLEIARLSSDTYMFVVEGPISPATRGIEESRYRGGAQLRYFLSKDLRIEAGGLVERVNAEGFVQGAGRTNIALTASMVWSPAPPLGSLSML
jgi:hypothetical protein